MPFLLGIALYIPPIRNSPTYTTWSIVIANFTSSYMTLKYIYVRNPLSLDFFSKNRLIKGSLILATLIPLIFSLVTYYYLLIN